MGEPAWSNEESTERLYMKHHAGMHDEIHNVYGLAWDKVVTEEFEKRNPDKRIFQMTRAGYAGLHRYTFGWSGDSGNGSNVNNGWSRLANQVQVAQSAGMGLIPFWSCDISGYCGDIKDYNELAELYVRWLQFGVFNPISRAHHEGNNAVEPWLFGEEAERISKKAIELKYQLFPYWYKYAREAHDTGVPLIRAMILQYPDDAEAMRAESQFMLGEELLVAPVVEKGAVSKRIYFPEGEWMVFGDVARKFKGGQWVDFPVTLETIPIFVRSGSVIPTMPVMQFIHQREHFPVTFNLYLTQSGKSVFTLYEDDGITNAYKKDEAAYTVLSTEQGAGKTVIAVESLVKGNYKMVTRNVLLRFAGKSKPSSVILAGKKLKSTTPGKLMESIESEFDEASWSYDKASGEILIRLPARKEKLFVEVRD
jgi:alpha-glucosidase